MVWCLVIVFNSLFSYTCRLFRFGESENNSLWQLHNHFHFQLPTHLRVFVHFVEFDIRPICISHTSMPFNSLTPSSASNAFLFSFEYKSVTNCDMNSVSNYVEHLFRMASFAYTQVAICGPKVNRLDNAILTL